MCSPEQLCKEQIDDYLYYCSNLHKTPSESFFKHTVFGLRAAYKVMGMEDMRIKLPSIKRQKSLPVVLSKSEVKELINAPKYLKHKLIIAMLNGCGLRSYESAFKTNKSVIEYLGRYTPKIAISNYRIRHIDPEKRTVIFSLKDYKKGGKKTTQTLSSKEFIRRFSMHILPRGFTRIRHFGILSSA